MCHTFVRKISGEDIWCIIMTWSIVRKDWGIAVLKVKVTVQAHAFVRKIDCFHLFVLLWCVNVTHG